MQRSSNFVLAAVLGLASSIACSQADGQDYEVMPLNAKFDLKQIVNEPEINGDEKKAAAELRRRHSEESKNKRAVFSSGRINSRFQGYYKQVVIPELTRYDSASLKDLTNKRQDLRKEFTRSIRNPTVRAFLIRDVFFPELSKIVQGNFHPAVRYNAMVMVGELDEVAGLQNSSPPRPYRLSLPFLISQYNGLVDPKLQYLKYGAFKGISRIAMLDAQRGFLPAPQQAQVKTLMTNLLGAKPADLDADLFTSMQRKAVQVMGMYGDVANADAYANLLSDPAINYWTKLAAVQAYSKMKSQTVDAAKLDAFATAAAKFLHEVLTNEVAYMDFHQQRIAVLAARASEVGQVPGSPGGTGGKKKRSGGGDRGGLMSGGGGAGASPGAGGMAPGGGGGGAGASPGAGGMAPGGGGAGRRSGGGGATEAVPLEELPAYRIEITRRRIKTIAGGLYTSFGSPADPTGMLRWASGPTLEKLSAFKTMMNEADMAAEVGLENASGFIQSPTDQVRSELQKVADSIASKLGIVAPAKDANGKPAGKKPAGDGFLNN